MAREDHRSAAQRRFRCLPKVKCATLGAKSWQLLFRPLYASFLVELATRRVVHVGVTRHTTDAWAAQQLREATPYWQHPKHRITDNDSNPAHICHHSASACHSHVTCHYFTPLEAAISGSPQLAPAGECTRERCA
jgi:hypothetical protein